jgi:riboflavin biosynthesis pyrimidine reductase
MIESFDAARLQRLYPAPAEPAALTGLYLRHALHRRSQPCVYANFIASLDGRVALADRQGALARMPSAILNPRDWQLYQELVAQADVVLVGAGYLNYRSRQTQGVVTLLDSARDGSLRAWRAQEGLSPEPALAVVSRELAISEELVRAVQSQPLYIVTSRRAPAARINALERAGAQVLFAGDTRDVAGAILIEALRAANFMRICSVAGPRVLHLLLKDDCLDRLYLTTGLRLLGGCTYATLVEGSLLPGAPAFNLEALYFDSPVSESAGQLFGVYTRERH